MVEGSAGIRENDTSLKPTAPLKNFYKKDKEECEIVPSIPPRPLMAPKLPMKSSRKTKEVVNKNSYPLEDNIYTGLKPEQTVNKFYYSNLMQQNGQIAVAIPADFIAKAFIGNDKLIGLQQGKITVLSVDKLLINTAEGMNRQFYELVPLNLNNKSFLAFQDTGNVFKVHLENGNLLMNLLLRAAIPSGTAKILLRPEVEEIWVVGLRETSILMLNQRDEDVALVKRVASHFPDSTAVTFLNAEEMAVTQRDRSVQVFTVARFSHQPALIANLPAVIGETVKIIKTSANSYGTIYSDGKMIIWKVEKDELKEKISVPLTLFRIQTAHHVVSDNFVWLGLGNGKILVVKIDGEKQIILSEAKYHQTAIVKFIKCEDKMIGSLDASGQLCTWDENLTFYKQSKQLKYMI